MHRLTGWWTWWRLGLHVASMVLLALAVTVDDDWLAALLATAALGPQAVLAALGGSRTDENHLAGAALSAKVKNLESRSDRDRTSLARDRRRIDQLSGELRAVLAAEHISVLVALEGDNDAAMSFVEALLERLPRLSYVVVDRSGQPWLAPDLIDKMASHPGVGLVSSGPDVDLVDDLNAVRGAVRGTYILALEPTLTVDDIDDIAWLVDTVPAPHETQVSARCLAYRDDLVVIASSVLDEVGGWRGSVHLDRTLREALAARGHVIDTAVARRRTLDGRTLFDGRRARPAPSRVEGALDNRICLFPQAQYHTDELIPLGEHLELSGHTVAVVVDDRWWPAVRRGMHRSSADLFAAPDLGPWVGALRAVVTMNDWATGQRPLVEAAKSEGVLTFAKVEGAQDFEDADIGHSRGAYRAVDHVLCQGVNDVEAVLAFGGTPHLVGSSRLEGLWQQAPRSPGAHLAIINMNFTWGVLDDAREEFLATAVEGCRRAGIDVVVSAHPAETTRPVGVEVSDQPIARLLTRASVLISRFSTVPFEAMARGVPFVYHNPHGERVPTFSRPDGAFEISHDASELGDALVDAMSWEANYRERCESFFRQQVDIDPDHTSAERAAAVIGDQLRRQQEARS